MWQVETLEGRRLMSSVVVVVGTMFDDPIVGPGVPFDPIVGPMGTTPGTIGNRDSRGGLVIGGSFGGGGTVIVGGTGGSDLFFRKGFPVLFGNGGVMRMRGGRLNITGTHAHDTILVERSEDVLGQTPGLDITINGQTRRLSGSVFPRFVRAISIDAGRGDDVVAADEDLNIALVVRGGRGNDSIAGGARNDTLFGGPGNDYLVGGDGRDVLHGEDGNDTIEGGDGRDRMFGGRGNDVFLNGDDDSRDTVIGGLGDDVADNDEEDLIREVEG